MPIRMTAALVLGLPLAMVAATLVFLAASGDLDVLAKPRLAWQVPLIGAFAAAPGWLIAIVVALPVATHRTRNTSLNVPLYYGMAASIGAVSTQFSLLNLLALQSGEANVISAMLLPCGAAAGLSLAASWHLLVLNPLAQRRDVPPGATHG